MIKITIISTAINTIIIIVFIVHRRYTDGTKLIAHDVSHEVPTCITFNPGNWRQLSLSTQKEMTVWTVEQHNDKYKITRR